MEKNISRLHNYKLQKPKTNRFASFDISYFLLTPSMQKQQEQQEHQVSEEPGEPGAAIKRRKLDSTDETSQLIRGEAQFFTRSEDGTIGPYRSVKNQSGEAASESPVVGPYLPVPVSNNSRYEDECAQEGDGVVGPKNYLVQQLPRTFLFPSSSSSSNRQEPEKKKEEEEEEEAKKGGVGPVSGSGLHIIPVKDLANTPRDDSFIFAVPKKVTVSGHGGDDIVEYIMTAPDENGGGKSNGSGSRFSFQVRPCIDGFQPKSEEKQPRLFMVLVDLSPSMGDRKNRARNAKLILERIRARFSQSSDDEDQRTEFYFYEMDSTCPNVIGPEELGSANGSMNTVPNECFDTALNHFLQVHGRLPCCSIMVTDDKSNASYPVVPLVYRRNGQLVPMRTFDVPPMAERSPNGSPLIFYIPFFFLLMSSCNSGFFSKGKGDVHEAEKDRRSVRSASSHHVVSKPQHDRRYRMRQTNSTPGNRHNFGSAVQPHLLNSSIFGAGNRCPFQPPNVAENPKVAKKHGMRTPDETAEHMVNRLGSLFSGSDGGSSVTSGSPYTPGERQPYLYWFRYKGLSIPVVPGCEVFLPFNFTEFFASAGTEAGAEAGTEAGAEAEAGAGAGAKRGEPSKALVICCSV